MWSSSLLNYPGLSLYCKGVGVKGAEKCLQHRWKSGIRSEIYGYCLRIKNSSSFCVPN
jgi:hypothetical protein